MKDINALLKKYNMEAFLNLPYIEIIDEKTDSYWGIKIRMILSVQNRKFLLNITPLEYIPGIFLVSLLDNRTKKLIFDDAGDADILIDIINTHLDIPL